MKRAEEGLGAGQELVQKRPRVQGTLVCGGQEAGDGSEGQSPRSRGLGEQRAAQPGLTVIPAPGASLHALDPLRQH